MSTAPAAGHVYFLKRGDLVKIGFSKDVAKRMSTFQQSVHDLIATIPDVPMSREREVHFEMRKWWRYGEWFDLTPESLTRIEQIVSGEETDDLHVFRDEMRDRRRLRASIAAHESWAATEDRSTRTAPARRALDQKFLDAADGDPLRAESLRKAHFKRLALLSAESRSRKKAARGR